MNDTLKGLSVHHKEDGCWLMFEASNGLSAAINLNEEARCRGPIVRNAILQWIDDVKPLQGGDVAGMKVVIDPDMPTDEVTVTDGKTAVTINNVAPPGGEGVA